MSSKDDPLKFLNPDPSQMIWRYLDLPRFLSLIDKAKLYFSRLDLLGDPFEGSVTKHDLKDQEETWLMWSQESGTPAGMYEQFYRQYPDDPRKTIFVSCWHMGTSENFAMWKLYSDQHKGISIRTTVKKLQSFIPEEGRVRRVEYIDYKKDRVREIAPIYCKRKAFAHEKEVRAVIQKEYKKGMPKGLEIDVQLDEFIDEIRVSPQMPDWIFNLIRRLTDKYNLSVPVIKSELDKEPVFDWYTDPPVDD